MTLSVLMEAREVAHEFCRAMPQTACPTGFHTATCDEWTAAIEADRAAVRAATMEEAAQLAEALFNAEWERPATLIAARLRSLATTSGGASLRAPVHPEPHTGRAIKR